MESYNLEGHQVARGQGLREEGVQRGEPRTPESRRAPQQRLHGGNVLLKFTLHHPDPDEPGAEEGGAGQGGAPGLADGRGCLLSCFPTCQRPAYRAGQVITGHLMVRPVSRIVISGGSLVMP